MYSGLISAMFGRRKKTIFSPAPPLFVVFKVMDAECLGIPNLARRTALLRFFKRVLLRVVLAYPYIKYKSNFMNILYVNTYICGRGGLYLYFDSWIY